MGVPRLYATRFVGLLLFLFSIGELSASTDSGRALLETSLKMYADLQSYECSGRLRYVKTNVRGDTGQPVDWSGPPSSEILRDTFRFAYAADGRFILRAKSQRPTGFYSDLIVRRNDEGLIEMYLDERLIASRRSIEEIALDGFQYDRGLTLELLNLLDSTRQFRLLGEVPTQTPKAHLVRKIACRKLSLKETGDLTLWIDPDSRSILRIKRNRNVDSLNRELDMLNELALYFEDKDAEAQRQVELGIAFASEEVKQLKRSPNRMTSYVHIYELDTQVYNEAIPDDVFELNFIPVRDVN